MEKKTTFAMTIGVSNEMDNDINFAMRIGSAINRFMNKDWGDLCDEDKQLNDQALKTKDRILAMYMIMGRKIYIITDPGHEITTILFASEY